jgi:hypothetical protein
MTNKHIKHDAAPTETANQRVSTLTQPGFNIIHFTSVLYEPHPESILASGGGEKASIHDLITGRYRPLQHANVQLFYFFIVLNSLLTAFYIKYLFLLLWS